MILARQMGPRVDFHNLGKDCLDRHCSPSRKSDCWLRKLGIERRGTTMGQNVYDRPDFFDGYSCFRTQSVD
jgi:hypothetical protein